MPLASRRHAGSRQPDIYAAPHAAGITPLHTATSRCLPRYRSSRAAPCQRRCAAHCCTGVTLHETATGDASSQQERHGYHYVREAYVASHAMQRVYRASRRCLSRREMLLPDVDAATSCVCRCRGMPCLLFMLPTARRGTAYVRAQPPHGVRVTSVRTATRLISARNATVRMSPHVAAAVSGRLFEC